MLIRSRGFIPPAIHPDSAAQDEGVERMLIPRAQVMRRID